MEEKKIWDVSITEIERQCAADPLRSDSNSPIELGYVTLDPCISGGQEVLSNSELKQLFKELYLGR